MIVLLNCSINLLANDTNNDTITSYREAQLTSSDSVLIAYDDLRIVNSKLIELKYEKQINENLKQIIINDSIIISSNKAIQEKIINNNKKLTTQRDICLGAAIAALTSSLILIFK